MLGASRRKQRGVMRLTPQSAMVVRLLLVVDIVMVAAVGTISALFVDRPAGLIGAALSLVTVVALLALLPQTDPYRAERRPAALTPTPAGAVDRVRPPVWIATGGTSLTAALTGEFDITASPDDASIAVLDDDRPQLRQVRARHPDLFIIAIVAGTSPRPASEVVVSLLHAGADRCLISPKVEEVAAQVHSVARRMRLDSSERRGGSDRSMVGRPADP